MSDANPTPGLPPEPPLVIRVDPVPQPWATRRSGWELRRSTLNRHDLVIVVVGLVCVVGLGLFRGRSLGFIAAWIVVGELVLTHLGFDRLFRPLRNAILWCFAFLGTQLASAVLVFFLVLGVHALRSDRPGDFLTDQFAGLGKAAAPNAPPDARPPIPFEIGQGLAWGMLAAQFASLGLILLVVPRWVGPDWKRQLAVRRPGAFHVFMVVLLVPAFMLLSGGLEDLVVRWTGAKPLPGTEALRGVFSHWPRWLTVLTVGLGPGVVEELWCRGFLGRGLCARYGLVVGVILTSLLFAWLHLHPVYTLVYGAMGAYLHFVYLASRSIWVPVLLHALNNSLAVLAMLSGLVVQLNPEHNTLGAVTYLAAFSLLLFASVALWTGRVRVRRTELRDIDQTGEPVRAWEPEYPGVSVPPPDSGHELRKSPPSPAAVAFALASFAALVYLLSR
jgi:CAAX protease family protein